MGFRNPLYLDIPLLKNLADYYGVEVPVTAQVVRRTVAEKGRGAGVKKIVEAHLESGKTEELTETFATELRPVRLMNDVIDQLIAENELTDLTVNPSADLVNQVPVQVEGVLTLSPVTEIASLLARFMPLLIAQAQQGSTEFNLDESEMLRLFMAPQAESHPQVFSMALSESPHRSLVLVADPKHMVAEITSDDLEGEVTVFGTIDRLLSDTAAVSLDKYLLPGMNRAMRRAMGRTSIEDLVRSFAELPGHNVEVDLLTVSGPGAIIRPVAIY